MKTGALHLLVRFLLVCTTALGPALTWVEGTAGPAAPAALFRDDFDDTSQLQTVDTLVAQGGYLQVPLEVEWLQDTFADFYPGTGTGVDLYAQPGTIVLSRFSPSRRVNDVPDGAQLDVDAAFAQRLERAEDIPYLYVVWADGRGGDLDIYFSRSTDGGFTWPAGRRLNLADTAGDQRRPTIAASGANIHVAWEDPAGVHYAHSVDYGDNWFTDTLLAPGGSDADVAATYANPLSLAYILYVAEESPGDGDVYCLRSPNGGLSWDPPQNVVAGEPAGAAQANPSVGMIPNADTPWAAWEDDRDGDWGIYAGQRTGPSWSNARVDAAPAGSAQSDPALFFPAGAVLPHCAWADDRGGASDLYWAQYDVDLLQWVEGGAVTSGAGAGAPAVAAFGTQTWAGWTASAPEAYDTVWLGSYRAGAWDTPSVAPDQRPYTSRSSPAVAQADLSRAVVAALWSDDRSDAGDVFVATCDGGYWVTGTYTSTAHDFGDLTAWGTISWTGSSLAYVTLQARSGDTPAPDPSWSPWTEAANGGDVPVPPARYLQVRLWLDRPPLGTPAVDSVRVVAYPRSGRATSVPVGRCVAAWDEFSAEGYVPLSTTTTVDVLDLSGTVLYSDVVSPLDLSALPAAQYPRLRLRVGMERSPAETPLLNWWQVTWEEGSTHAAFSFEPPVVYTPTVLYFANHSTATVAPPAYQWDFGDGVTATVESPTHTYALPGTYTVTLQAAGECGSDVATATLAVRPAPLAPPSAAFSHGPLCTGQAVPFGNQSEGAIWWQWAFGDGSTSALFQPTHVYSPSGDYTVTLAVTNTRGSDRVQELLAVRPAPSASFTWTAELLTVAFTATAGGDPRLRWDFGDGFSSTLAQPVHVYAASGSYTVTLLAENACGAATAVAAVAVFCAPAGVAGFSWEPPAPAPGREVAFTAQVSGSAPLALDWDFGDGGTGQGPVVSHTFASNGAYTVTLAAANTCGQDTASRSITVAAPVYRAFLPLALRGYYPGDAFEPDGSPAQARLLLLDSPQRHDFAPPDDADWAYVELSAGVEYYLFTRDLSGGADTWVYLYAPGQYGTPLRQNDDCSGQTLASCVSFSPSESGRYELKVVNISGLWGPAVGYTLEVRLQ